MKKIKYDLTGKRFGRLTVIGQKERKPGEPLLWHCRCDCGTEKDLDSYCLRTGVITSCGCYQREVMYKIRFKDLTGKKFGRLTVLKCAGKTNNKNYAWLCKCECGNEVVVSSSSLIRGKTKSCGCYMRERAYEANVWWRTEDEQRIARILRGMKQRCLNPKNPRYMYYGARGITVCDEWKLDSHKFVEWALTHGYKPGLSIDRIDVNGPYSPDNCRWATIHEQASNKRTNHILTLGDKSLCISGWAREIGVSASVLLKKDSKSVIKTIREKVDVTKFLHRPSAEQVSEQITCSRESLKYIADPFLSSAYK